MTHTGSCLCGAVRYRVNGPMRDVVNCHCGQCRKTHGHFGAYTNCAKADLELVEQRGLGWYASTPGVGRGFCRECGATMFWQRDAEPDIGISAGTLDAPTGLRTIADIYVASKGDYYEIPPGQPSYPASSGS